MSYRWSGTPDRVRSDELSRIHFVWLAADVLVLGGVVGFLLLGFLGLMPFDLGFGISCLSALLLFLLDILQRRWLIAEFERLIRQPTWSAASGGVLVSPHRGHVSVFRAEGRLAGRFRGRL